jgi:multidrug efflux pump subunit AcrA (membrane-fusion protein)
MNEQDAPYGATDRAKPAWFQRTWVMATAAGTLGLVLGIASSGSADVTSTPEYEAVAAERDAATEEAEKARDLLADAEEELHEVEGDLPAREAALEKAQQELTKREAAIKKAERAVAKAEKAVAKREKAVGIIEKEIARNTISGDGMYKVGAEIKPGTYRTSGAVGCYYAVLNSTDTSDIAENNNIDGPAFVTVSEGQYLEVVRCADWVLQR